eukprot:TRINITY_DN1031_c0_g2_i1.p1 TRINITY_DN1031_c0_g2~~TRINITY_DN1031_c0_g2_i1.p1  ORF type:complete len:1767 (+),score=728.11 TRINITY_DN1031_c0_g2_i1:17998-23298(+)
MLGIEPAPALAGGHAGQTQGRQLAPRLFEFLAATGQLFDGEMSFAGLPGRLQLTLDVVLLQHHVGQLLVQRGQAFLDRGLARGQCGGAELVVARVAPDTAPTPAIAPIGLRRDPLTALARALDGVGHPADLCQLAQQPGWCLGREAQHCQQAVGRRLGRCGGDIGDHIMAIALALGQGHGGALILAVFQHHHPARGAQHTFGGGTPMVIGDLDQVGQDVMADACLAQAARELLHLARLGRLVLAGQPLQCPLGILALALQRAPAVIEFGLLLFQLGHPRHQLRGVPLHRRQGLQFVGLAHQRLDRFLGIARLLLGAVSVVLVLLQRSDPVAGFLLLLHQLRQLQAIAGTLASLRIVMQALAVQLAQAGSRALAFFMPAQYGDDFSGQDLALAQLALVLAIQVHTAVELRQLRLAMRQFLLGQHHLGRQVALVAAGFFVAVQHFLVTEDFEDQAQQFLGREFAQAVGLALFQRQHAGNRARQAGTFKTATPMLQPQPFLLRGLGQGFDGDVAIAHAITPLPVTAIALDAAGQGHLVGIEQVAGEGSGRGLAAMRTVVHRGAQPGGIGIGMAGVGLVAAPARAFQTQQRAHGIEQRGLAGTVGAGNGDDGTVQRHGQALAVVPLQQFKGLQVEHQASPSGSCCGSGAGSSCGSAGVPTSASVCASRAVARASTSPSAPSRMRGARASQSSSRSSSGPSAMSSPRRRMKPCASRRRRLPSRRIFLPSCGPKSASRERQDTTGLTAAALGMGFSLLNISSCCSPSPLLARADWRSRLGSTISDHSTTSSEMASRGSSILLLASMPASPKTTRSAPRTSTTLIWSAWMLSTRRKPTWARRSCNACHRSASTRARRTRGCLRGSQRRASSSAASRPASSGVSLMVFFLGRLGMDGPGAHGEHIGVIDFFDDRQETRLPGQARQVTGLALQRARLAVAQQWQQLHAIGGLAEAAAQHHIGQRLRGERLGAGLRQLAQLRELRQLADQVAQLHRHAQGFHFTGHGLCRRWQALGALRIGAVAFEFALGHVHQFVAADEDRLDAHRQCLPHQLRGIGVRLQPAPHVRTGHAGAAQGHALAVGLLQGAGELAGHGQQARLAIAQGTCLAFQAGIVVFAADQGGECLAGPVHQLQGTLEAWLGLAQAGLGTAFDGIGELVVQARQLGMQVADLAGVGQAQRLGASHLGQQRGHVVILADGARQGRQQGLQLLGQRRERIILGGSIPDHQAELAQALQGAVERFGLEGVEELVEVFALQPPLRLGGQLQEYPQPQARRRLAAREQPAQAVQHLQALAQAPGQGRLRRHGGVAEVAFEGAGFVVVRRGGRVDVVSQFGVDASQDAAWRPLFSVGKSASLAGRRATLQYVGVINAGNRANRRHVSPRKLTREAASRRPRTASGPLADLGALAGPGAGLLGQGQAQAGTGRHQHAALLQLQPFMEQRLQPLEVLHPGLGRIGCCQVYVQLHGEVRRQHQPGMAGQPGHLQEGRDAAHARTVRHEVVGGAVADQVAMLGGAGEHLAGGNGRIELGGQGGVAFVVVAIQRLFDPDQVELFEGAAHALRGGPIPLLVGIDHQREVAQVLAHRGDTLDVQGAVGLADLELDAADALLARGRGIDQQLLQRRMQEAAAGVVAAYRIAMRSQQLGQRQPGALGLHVPQGDVEGADGLGRQAAATHRGAGPAQLVPDLADVIGVFTEEGRGDLAGMGKLPGAAGALGIAEAQALVAVGGFDLDEEHGDLGHRLLAPGEDLGVADGIGQRQVGRGNPDPGDLVAAGGCG